MGNVRRKLQILAFGGVLCAAAVLSTSKASAWDQCEICLWGCDNGYAGCINSSADPAFCDAQYDACYWNCYGGPCS